MNPTFQTISATGCCFTDEYGRQRIFNGLNYVYKGAARDDDGVIRYQTSITPEVAARLHERGINIIRLGVTWAGIEPTMCEYNMAYLQGVKDTLKILEENGIYAFLDWHQDLYGLSCFATGGDGAPQWACSQKGRQGKSLLIWAEGYFFGKKVQRSFDDFWNNKEIRHRGLMDRFCDMLSFSVEYFSDCPNVMGYDVLNEPFPGTPGGKIFAKLVANGAATLLLSKRVNRKKLISDALNGRIMELLSVADDKIVYHGVIDAANRDIYRFDTEKYYPFLVKCAEAIRSKTYRGIIFMENCYYSNLGIPHSCPKIVYENGETEQKLAFAPHGYDITVDSPLTNEASPYRVDFIFDEHKRRQNELNIPVLVGEWGGMVEGSDKYPALEHLVDKFDKNQWSNTYWHFRESLIEENSGIMDILSRPYPQAVAGKIKQYGLNRNLNSFSLTYEGSSSIKAPTLIYLPHEPKAVFSTKKYTIKPLGNACILQVYAGKGDCTVQVDL